MQWFKTCLLVLPLALAGCVGGVNDSVEVPAGASQEDATTVNGSVRVGANATVSDATTVNGSVSIAKGAKVDDATSVNGSVTLAENAQAGEATTVNGDVTLAAGAKVDGDVTTVNGDLDLAPGSSVGGELTNVNGAINVDGARVGKGLNTVSADINVRGKAVVDGGIHVEKPEKLFGMGGDESELPRIVIGPGATVNGPLVFERKVSLYISEQAQVAGPITGAQAVRFSGATPPAAQ